MWTREEKCKEIIKLAWDPYTKDSSWPCQDRLERCQRQLQCWNHNSFRNVYKILKQKQNCLQQLKPFNMLHETAEEIQVVRKEINDLRIREEIIGTKGLECFGCKDKNTNFFHATTSQRHKRIE